MCTGSSQAVAANFDVTLKPTLLSVGNVFVFNPGQWEVEIEAQPGKFSSIVETAGYRPIAKAKIMGHENHDAFLKIGHCIL